MCFSFSKYNGNNIHSYRAVTIYLRFSVEFFCVIDHYNGVRYRFFEAVLYVFRPVIRQFAVGREVLIENPVDKIYHSHVGQRENSLENLVVYLNNAIFVLGFPAFQFYITRFCYLL